MKAWIYSVSASLAIAALAATPALASEANFERTLSVSGSVTLHVSTGSGNIHIEPGSDSQIHIVGHVRSHGYDNDDRVKQIAANPPIEQTGDFGE